MDQIECFVDRVHITSGEEVLLHNRMWLGLGFGLELLPSKGSGSAVLYKGNLICNCSRIYGTIGVFLWARTILNTSYHESGL